MKIVSKCGQVQVALHLRDNEVTMQVEKMPEWIRGKYPTGKPCCCRAAFGLYSLVRPELRAYGVYLWGDVVDADSRVASCFFDTVKSAAHYCQQVQDLIESFDSRTLVQKRSETITSKCGKVKVQLDLDDCTVSMKVLEMPDELRGKHDSANPMHVAHGLDLHSNVDPTLYGPSVYLRGTMRECDDNVAKRRDSSPSDAISYYDRVKELIETFDSTGLMKKGEKKEWRIVAAPDTVIGMPVYRLYRFQFERWCPVAQSMFYGDAHALAAALNIEVED